MNTSWLSTYWLTILSICLYYEVTPKQRDPQAFTAAGFFALIGCLLARSRFLQEVNLHCELTFCPVLLELNPTKVFWKTDRPLICWKGIISPCR